MSTARLTVESREIDLPVVTGSEGEQAIDIRTLRRDSGLISLDTGYGNTGSCQSAITFIDGEKGILRYRGYSIEDLAGKSSFTEVAYLLLNNELPTTAEFDEFQNDLIYHSLLHEDMKKFFEGYPAYAHPMTVLSAMVASLGTFYPENDDHSVIRLNAVRLIAKIKTIAAFSYKKAIGQPFVYPTNKLSYCADFLKMMFAVPSEEYEIAPLAEAALDKLLILHADHEQNCSTSTVRMVGSSGADLFSSISAGISALSGPLHGRANQEVIEMLEAIKRDGGDYAKYVEKAKDKDDPFRLMGFGHRVYKNFDPRAQVIKDAAAEVLNQLGLDDPLLDIAMNLERVALEDDYFIERKLYPNVDFYSGILYRAMRIPREMFTVMFAMGRLPGWIAHFLEMREDPSTKIHRPRQVYIGENGRPYLPLADR
jgi:citrate synthase